MKQALHPSTFDRFARHPCYTGVNRYLIQLVPLRDGETVVDLGCGTGATTALILERVSDVIIVAVDPSPQALAAAKRNLPAASARAVIFVQGRAEELSNFLRSKVDSVVFCNTIHLVADKVAVIKQVSQVLRAGGTFAFNTAFFDGAISHQMERFYKRLMLKAVRILKKDYGISLRKQEKASARQQLAPEEYSALLLENNFQIRRQEVKEIQLPLKVVKALFEFDDFIEGALPGVAFGIGSRTLKRAAVETFKELTMRSLPRNWLQMVAEKV